MKKKCISIATAVMMFAAVFATPAVSLAAEKALPKVTNQASNSAKGIQTKITKTNGFEFDQSTGTIIDYSGNATTLEVPSTIGGVAVTGIGNSAFGDCESLKSITLPNSVTRIGKSAFTNCYSLKSITIPNSVTSIREDAFYTCGLRSVTIPKSVTKIGDRAFSFCVKLKSVTISNGVAKIGTGAFCACQSLRSIRIPKSVTKIGSGAFGECESLKSVSIPKSVTNIGSEAFINCDSLKSITIPKSVTSIGQKAFGYKWVQAYPEYSRFPNFTICGYSGSAAEVYAKKHKFSFKKVQTITAKSFTKTYGSKSFNLKAKAKTKLSYHSSNKKVATVNDSGKVSIKGIGKATITIKAAATARYKSATKKIVVTVKPKQTASVKARSSKSQTLKVSWKRDKQASGYQAVVALDKKFQKGKKTITIKKNKTTSVTFKKLEEDKQYYYKVRSYKTVNSKRMYGSYSKVKRAKVQ